MVAADFMEAGEDFTAAVVVFKVGADSTEAEVFAVEVGSVAEDFAAGADSAAEQGSAGAAGFVVVPDFVVERFVAAFVATASAAIGAGAAAAGEDEAGAGTVGVGGGGVGVGVSDGAGIGDGPVTDMAILTDMGMSRGGRRLTTRLLMILMIPTIPTMTRTTTLLHLTGIGLTRIGPAGTRIQRRQMMLQYPSTTCRHPRTIRGFPRPIAPIVLRVQTV